MSNSYSNLESDTKKKEETISNVKAEKEGEEDDRSNLFQNLPAQFAQARREEAKAKSLCLRCLVAGQRISVVGLEACPRCGCKTTLVGQV